MTILLFVSLAIYICSLALALLQKGRIEKSVRIMGAGTLIVALLLLCAIITNYNCTANSDDSIPLISVLFSVLQLGTLDADYNFWIKESSQISIIFRVFTIIICYSMPLIFGGFILSLFDGYMNILKYKLFRHSKTLYYFSELNTHALELAKSISSHDKKALIVFYGMDSAEDFSEELSEHGFLLLPYSFEQIIKKPSHRLFYFMIKTDESENLSEALHIISLYKEKYPSYSGFEKINITIFSQAKEAEYILNATDKKDITVHLVKARQQIANNLVFHYPLYDAPGWKETKKLSVLIVGAGDLGQAVLKNVIWCSQFGADYKTEINVIDKDCEHIESQLQHECPEFFNPKWNIKLNFYNADVSTASFDAVLKENCRDTNYAVVCLGDDETSINTALFLRSFFIFSDEQFSREPFIAVRISDAEKAVSIKELTAINREKLSIKGWDIYATKSENYNLIPFASDSELYTYESVVANELDALALNAHAAYQNMFSKGEIPAKQIRQTFNYSEIDKKSNISNVLHIKYKLHFLGFDIKKKELASAQELQNAQKCIEELHGMLNDEQKMEYLGRMEHDRWLAFQISQGWRSASINQAQVYSKKTGNHKHARAKLHPCICSWEELDKIISVFDPNLKEYDKQFILKMLQILGCEQSCINISNVHYILTKINKAGEQ